MDFKNPLNKRKIADSVETKFWQHIDSNYNYTMHYI